MACKVLGFHQCKQTNLQHRLAVLMPAVGKRCIAKDTHTMRHIPTTIPIIGTHRKGVGPPSMAVRSMLWENTWLSLCPKSSSILSMLSLSCSRLMAVAAPVLRGDDALSCGSNVGLLPCTSQHSISISINVSTNASATPAGDTTIVDFIASFCSTQASLTSVAVHCTRCDGRRGADVLSVQDYARWQLPSCVWWCVSCVISKGVLLLEEWVVVYNVVYRIVYKEKLNKLCLKERAKYTQCSTHATE